MKNVKMTNQLALTFVLGLDQVKENQEVFEKLTKMLQQVEKKNNSGGKGKPTKAQLENESIKELILQELGTEPLQIKELMTHETLAEYSNQKLSALLRQMVESGIVTRVVDKKVTKFKLAE